MSPCFGSQASHDTEIKAPDSIRKLFEQRSNNGCMSTEDFQKFLTEYQEENETDVEKILRKYKEGLKVDDFFKYLREDSKLPLHKVDQDLDAPLAHYFIFTRVKISLPKTHKGKLRKNYLQRTKAMIAEALQSGVRAIQLDLFTSQKNVTDITPVVISKVLIECLGTIKQDAFQTNDYPVIVTFEGTLESSLQSMIVEKANFKLAGMWEDMDSITSSLTKLKKKILMPQLSKGISDLEDKKKVEDSTKSGHSGCKIESLELAKLKDELHEKSTTNSDDVKWYKMTHPDLEQAKDHGADLVKYTQRNLLMVDPKERITGRSNINPLTGWIHGAQMVAVNTQGYDKHLWAAHGFFTANGDHGYVKKPKILLNNAEVFDPNTKLRVKTTLKVKLYMGYGWILEFSRMQFDIFSPPDLFVKFQILGVPADKAKDQTDPFEDEWNPAWNQEFKFKIRVPELALLRIEVREYDNEDASAFGGQTCLPIWELKRGIRAIPLQDKQGVPYNSINLIMGFEFEGTN